MRLSERLVLQLVEGAPAGWAGPADTGSVDRLVLMDDHDGTEVVFDMATARALWVGLAYFIGRTGHDLPAEELAGLAAQLEPRTDVRPA